jgi:hypothetical protein
MEDEAGGRGGEINTKVHKSFVFNELQAPAAAYIQTAQSEDMMPRTKRVHVHKYMRRCSPNGDFPVWACGHSDCMHFLPRNAENLIKGKDSICCQCGKLYIINSFALDECLENMEGEVGFLKCESCRTPKEIAGESISEVLDRIMREKKLQETEEDKPTSE